MTNIIKDEEEKFDNGMLSSVDFIWNSILDFPESDDNDLHNLCEASGFDDFNGYFPTSSMEEMDTTINRKRRYSDEDFTFLSAPEKKEQTVRSDSKLKLSSGSSIISGFHRDEKKRLKPKQPNPKYALNSRNMQRLMREGLCKVVAALKEVKEKHEHYQNLFEKVKRIELNSSEMELCIHSIIIFLRGVLCTGNATYDPGDNGKGEVFILLSSTAVFFLVYPIHLKSHTLIYDFIIVYVLS